MKNHEGVYIKLHKINDNDLIKRLSEVQNKQGYIKDLIKQDSSIYKKFKGGLCNGQHNNDHTG